MKRKIYGWIARYKKILLCICAFCFIAVIAMFTVESINQSLYKERTTNIEMLISRVALNIEDSLEQQWKQAEFFKHDFADKNPDSMKEVLAYLEEAETKTSDDIQRFYVIDENARCYRSDGESYRWKDSSVLLSDERVCSISTQELQIRSEGTCMMFVV